MKLRRIAAGILSALMVVTSVHVMPAHAQETSGSDVVLRFVVASDYHMEKAGDARGKRLKEMFDTAYAYAAQQSYNKIDAFVLNGDMVNFGKTEEYAEFKKVMDSANISQDTKVLTVMGNHEWWADKNNHYAVSGNKAYLDGISAVTSITEKGMNWSVDINGYKFLGMSQEKTDIYSEATLKWMNDEVDKACKENKPVFTFQHFAPKQTVYGSFTKNMTWDSNGELTAVYEGHPQVINFSGHSHAPINTPTAINQTTFTQYTTGTGYYYYLDTSATYGPEPPNGTNVAQYTIVEVTRDNQVNMRPYDQYAAQFFTELNDSGKDIVYNIDVNDTENWKYTKSRADKEQAPYFENATAGVTDITYKSAKISFPQAKDDTGVYAYNIKCDGGNGDVRNYRIFSEWYFSKRASVLSYSMTGLKESTTYTISVTPVDFFDKTGDAISTTFTTTKRAEGGDLTLGFKWADDTNGWTFTNDNPIMVAGQYYKAKVTIDGADGHIVFSKQKDGAEFQVWVSFFPLYQDAKLPERNLKVTAGTEFVEVTSAWTELSSGDSFKIKNDLYVKQTAGVWSVAVERDDDNIVLEPEKYEKNHVPNGNFEAGINNSWSQSSNMSIVSDRVHSGNYAVKLVNNGSQASAKATATLEGGHFYRLTAWFYVDENAAVKPFIRRQLILGKSPWDNLDSSYDDVTVEAGEWCKYEYSFELKEGKDFAQFLFYTDTKGSGFYLDDISIQQICAHEFLEHVLAKDSEVCGAVSIVEHYSCRECGKLFLTEKNAEEGIEATKDSVFVPVKHTTKKVDGKAATCTKAGVKEHYTCSKCGKLFADAAGTKEITKASVTIAAAHKPVKVAAKKATTSKTGVKEHYKCSACGKLFTSASCKTTTTLSKLTIAKIKVTVKKTKVKKVTAKSKALAVQWSKVSGVTGYEVQVALNKSFKKGLKKTTVKGASKTSVTVKKLKAKKTYYVRVRAYKKVDGKNFYSSWTTVTKKKTK